MEICVDDSSDQDLRLLAIGSLSTIALENPAVQKFLIEGHFLELLVKVIVDAPEGLKQVLRVQQLSLVLAE